MNAIEYLRMKWTLVAGNDPTGIDQEYYDHNRDAKIAELVGDKPKITVVRRGGFDIFITRNLNHT